jgi:hypothetical protein
MPSFEWESYLYNYASSPGLSGRYGAGSIGMRGASPMVSTSVGSITVNINGGDTNKVKSVVDAALKANFGSLATATVSLGRMM